MEREDTTKKTVDGSPCESTMAVKEEYNMNAQQAAGSKEKNMLELVVHPAGAGATPSVL